MAYLSPTRWEDAFAALAQGEATLIAGGTDWFAQDRAGGALPRLLDVTGLPGCRGISRSGDQWRIGAATSWTEVILADLPPAFAALKAAAREVGSPQIQNAGSVAGNLCNASPAADGVPPLLVLRASVEIASSQGRRALPLAEFITGARRTALKPGEIVSALLIPDPELAARSGFYKLGSRRYMVISIAMVAILLGVEGGLASTVRIAVGACSPVAQRLEQLERDLLGWRPGQAMPPITAAHLAPLAPIDDIRASAAYRLDSLRVIIPRLLTDLADLTGQGA